MSEAYIAGPLQLMDCWIIPLATGVHADSLITFRDRIEEVPESSLIGHYVAGAMRPAFERRKYNNDFANWAGESLRDHPLGERLAMVRATDGPTLRDELAVVLDARISEVGDIYATEPFRFVDRQIVTYPTPHSLTTPRDLCGALESMSDESLFYHVLDACWRRSDDNDDFSEWLSRFAVDGEPLRKALEAVDVRFMSVQDVRTHLSSAVERAFA